MTNAVAPSADLVLWSRLGSAYSPAGLVAAFERREVSGWRKANRLALELDDRT